MTGWAVDPLEYIKLNPPKFEGERLSSQYVTVRDGTKLAIDLHLPGTIDDGAAYPVICIFTPYYRRFALRNGHRPDIDPAPTIAFYRDHFVPQGYALVCVDVRGSGASFGCRDGFRSPAERLDHYDIADWVSQQPWCDGNIGATGISYPGAASDFLASTNHPNVKAVAPLFAVWDTWSNHLYPGGVLLTCVTRNYGQLAEAMDLDRRDLIPDYAYFKDDDLAGPAPVDSDTNGEELAAALRDHEANFDMQDFAQQLRFRDAPLTDNPDYASDKISPYAYADRDADASTAYYSVSGWMDGGGYSLGTIQRHLWLENPSNRLMLGPWDHGARGHCSPWRPNRNPQQKFVAAEVTRFFDQYLKGVETAINDEDRVHYYTMGLEDWQSAPSWPPAHTVQDFYFSEDSSLSTDVPTSVDVADTYQADFGCGTGVHSRYDRLYIANVDTYYDDWDGRDARMLNYTSSPFATDTEVTGHPSIELTFRSSEQDCCFFVYLSDVTPDGRAVYVTEGVFRALHRAPGKLPENIPSTGPAHSFNRADAMHLVPGKEAHAAFELLPTSYLFRAGHRLRVSIAAADRDHFTRIPDGRPPLLTFLRNADNWCRLQLPIAG